VVLCSDGQVKLRGWFNVLMGRLRCGWFNVLMGRLSCVGGLMF
jgi:hypothetical protein